MNKALVAKVGWRLLQDKESLWARVLRCKYKVGSVHDPKWLVKKPTWSSTWKSVGVELREVVLPGLCWVIGDGSSIRFWTDKWVTGTALLEETRDVVPNEHELFLVRDLWQNGRGWDVSRIQPFISEN